MCTTWIIESSTTYSRFERDVIMTDINDIGDVQVEELHPVEALEKINNGEHPDIVILDTMLPGIRGADIIQKLEEKSPESKCIVVASDRRGTRLVDCGIPIIDKPFLPSLFIATFKKVYKSIFN